MPRVASAGGRNGLRALAVAGLFLLFLGGIDGLGEGFKGLGGGLLDAFFTAFENPVAGFLAGVLATTLVQSSSVTSALIVALVAAPESALPFESAIPMVMGANVGTTVTNTLVALADITDSDSVRRVFEVATCHDMFNLLAVLILLPLEIFTGFLGSLSAGIASALGNLVGAGASFSNPIGDVIAFVPAFLTWVAGKLAGTGPGAAGLLALFSAALLVFSLMLLVRTLKGLTGSGAGESIHRVLGRSAVLAMGVGAAVTVLVQSSSVTTSTMVPLAGAGLLLLEDAFPVTLGANIGTTFTAFLASLAVSGPNAHWGFQIAVVHLLFNLIAIAIVYPFPPIRRIPLAGARWLARLAVRSRVLAVAYVLGAFYIIPAGILLISRAAGY